jgi:hypothetical protein
MNTTGNIVGSEFDRGYAEARDYLRSCAFVSANALRDRLRDLVAEADTFSDDGEDRRAAYLIGKAAAYRRLYRSNTI